MKKIYQIPTLLFLPIIFLGAWALYYLIEGDRWLDWSDDRISALTTFGIGALQIVGAIGLLYRVRFIYWIVTIGLGLTVFMWGANAANFKDLVYSAKFIVGAGVMYCLIHRRTQRHFSPVTHPKSKVEQIDDGNSVKPPGVERTP